MSFFPFFFFPRSLQTNHLQESGSATLGLTNSCEKYSDVITYDVSPMTSNMVCLSRLFFLSRVPWTQGGKGPGGWRQFRKIKYGDNCPVFSL